MENTYKNIEYHNTYLNLVSYMSQCKEIVFCSNCNSISNLELVKVINNSVCSKIICAFDCETFNRVFKNFAVDLQKNNCFGFMCLVDGSLFYTYFELVDDFFVFVKKLKNRRFVCYCFNFSYDGVFLRNNKTFDINVRDNNGNMYVAYMKNKYKSKFTFIDASRIFNSSRKYNLNVLGKYFFNEKKEDINYEIAFNLLKYEKDITYIVNYNIQDCKITLALGLLAWMFNDKKDVWTVGSLAMKNLKKRLKEKYKNKYEIKFINRKDERSEYIIRDSYHGGKIDCNYIGNILSLVDINQNNIYYVDVNSLYPFIMRSFKTIPNPFSSVKRVDIPNITDCEGVIYLDVHTNKILKYPIFAEVLEEKIKDEYGVNHSYSVLSYLNVTKGCVRAITYDEYRYLLDMGFILDLDFTILYCLEVDRIDNFLIDYINEWEEIKNIAVNENNDGVKEFAKIIMNATYGKFGQRLDFDDVIDESDDRNIKRHYHDSWYNDCMLATYITARARLYLTKNILKIEEFDGKVFYYDTDSIIFSLDKKINVNYVIPISESEFGKFKIEHLVDGSLPSKFIILGKKMYYIEIGGFSVFKCRGYHGNRVNNKKIPLNYSELVESIESSMIIDGWNRNKIGTDDEYTKSPLTYKEMQKYFPEYCDGEHIIWGAKIKFLNIVVPVSRKYEESIDIKKLHINCYSSEPHIVELIPFYQFENKKTNIKKGK